MKGFMGIRRCYPIIIFISSLTLIFLTHPSPFSASANASTPVPAKPETAQTIPLSTNGSERASAVAFSSDGKLLAAGISYGIGIYNPQTQAQVRFIPTQTWVSSLAFSAGGKEIFAGLFDSTVKCWRADNGQLIRTFSGHTNWVRSISLSKDGSLLASASSDNTLRVWRVADGKPLLVVQKDASDIRAVAFSPDGQILAAGLPDGRINLWSAADGSLLRTLTGHTDWVRGLAFSPDGNFLASASFDKTVRLWSIPAGELLHTLEGHSASVLAVAFSPDGLTLASASEDMTARLWSIPDGTSAGVLQGHTSFVFSLAFSPDGQILATGANDNSVRLWALGDQLSGTVPAAPATNQPPAEEPSQSQNCRQCHHRQGEIRPAKILEVRCDACHQNGIGISFCPAFRRSPQAPTGPVHFLAPAEELAGAPVAAPDLKVLIASPGNGETFYVRGTFSAPAFVTGQVSYSGGPLSQINLSLEVSSGAVQVAAVAAVPEADGTFRFKLDLNHGKSPPFMQKPSATKCASCHIDYQSQASLPTGAVKVTVIATAPDGERATDERWVSVDVSKTAALAVKVIDAESGRPLPGLSVQAGSVLYDWRSRYASAVSGQDGIANLQLEALTQAPTVYTISVLPAILNGWRYASSKPAEVTLPPGADTAAQVTLKVDVQKGQITGKVYAGTQAQLAGLTVWAVGTPAGPAFQSTLSDQGTFTFKDLPVGSYQVTMDPNSLNTLGFQPASQQVDLIQSPSQDITLNLHAGPTLSGQVEGVDGQPVPFAWLVTEPGSPVQAANPLSGKFSLEHVPSQPFSLEVLASGFYSDIWRLDPHSGNREVALQLVPRPETRRFSWGQGELILPPETKAGVDGLKIQLDQGWLWGEGGADQPLNIHTPDAQVTISNASFALGGLPGQETWLFVEKGAAGVQLAGRPDRISVTAGQMISLKSGAEPLPMDSSLLAALQPTLDSAPVPEVMEPSLPARLRHGLVRTGVGTAQLVTLITYFLILVALIVGPLSMLLWALKKRRLHPDAQKN